MPTPSREDPPCVIRRLQRAAIRALSATPPARIYRTRTPDRTVVMGALPATIALALLAQACAAPVPADREDASADISRPVGDALVDALLRDGGPPGALCDDVIDLNVRGRRVDGALSYVAPGPATDDQVTWRERGFTEAPGRVLTYLTAFRYTAPRTVTVDLHLLSRSVTQPVPLSIVALDHCALDAPMIDLDYVRSEGLLEGYVWQKNFRQGESAIFLVGTWVDRDPSLDEYCPFELRLHELPELAPGDTCGPTLGLCGRRLYCRHRGSDVGVCARACDLGEPCGFYAPGQQCAPGLACVRETCVRALRPGEPCGGQFEDNCPYGTHCHISGDRDVCVADGARGASCRSGDNPCDPGLRCNDFVCLPVVRAGDTCNALSVICEDGTHCLPPSAFEQRCVRDGTRGGRCLGADSVCDPGLACSDDRTPVCLRPVALGMPCTGAACESGAHCVEGRCVALPTRGPACGSGLPPCESGRTCSHGTCEALLAVGARCDGTRACVPHSTCHVPAGEYTEVCIRDGAPLGRCRPTTPRCDAGAICNEIERTDIGRCIPAGGFGAWCNGLSSACEAGLACNQINRCAPLGTLGSQCRASTPPCDGKARCVDDGFGTARCLTEGGAGSPCNVPYTACAPGMACVVERPAFPGVCAPIGAVGAPCRDTAPECSPGLACNLADRHCVPEVSTGRACDLEERLDRCAVGSSCLEDAAGDGRCVRDGAAGNRCRTTEPTCDPGTTCDGPPLALTARCR